MSIAGILGKFVNKNILLYRSNNWKQYCATFKKMQISLIGFRLVDAMLAGLKPGAR